MMILKALKKHSLRKWESLNWSAKNITNYLRILHNKYKDFMWKNNQFWGFSHIYKQNQTCKINAFVYNGNILNSKNKTVY